MPVNLGNITLAVLAAGAGIALLVPKGNDRQEHGHELMKLKLHNVQMQGRYLVMNVIVINEGKHDMRVTRLQGDFYANDKKVAGVNMVGDYQVGPGLQQVIPLIAIPVMQNLVTTSFRKNMKILFTGTVMVNTHTIPLTMSYTA